MIVKPGVVITNFLGRLSLAQEKSKISTDAILSNHPFGHRALGCGWIITFAQLRTIAEQLDFAFQIFDPLVSNHLTVPRIDNLSPILERASNLARLDRYLSGIEEFVSFFESVRSMKLAEYAGLAPKVLNVEKSCYNLRHRATLELSRLQQKIVHSQRSSRTYLAQYENLIQLSITYSTAHITERLDSGRKVAERFATVGHFLAGISSMLSPLALLTSFWGMNTQEFVGPQGGLGTLYEFWKWGMPLTVTAFIGIGYLAFRLFVGPAG